MRNASITGSTKAGIQAALSPLPAVDQVVSTQRAETGELVTTEPAAERYFFDPVHTGSYPPKPALAKTIDGVHGSQSRTFAPSASALESAVEQTGQSANDARALDMPIQHNKALPLELFDNPETEVVPPEDRINNRPHGYPGAVARSRFYNSRGEFAWAPCYVIAYDRYSSWSSEHPVLSITMQKLVAVPSLLLLQRSVRGWYMLQTSR